MISLFYIDVVFQESVYIYVNPTASGIYRGHGMLFSVQPAYSDYIPTLPFRWFPRALSPNHCRKHNVEYRFIR